MSSDAPASLVRIGEALTEIGHALDTLPDDATRCRVLSMVCSKLGMDDDAIEFSKLAKLHAMKAGGA